MTDNSRPPDWAVARAFWEAGKYHEQSPWWAIRYYIQDRAREIAEGTGNTVATCTGDIEPGGDIYFDNVDKRIRRVEVKDG